MYLIVMIVAIVKRRLGLYYFKQFILSETLNPIFPYDFFYLVEQERNVDVLNNK